ncbi:MAG: hypothetical protein ABL933_15815 [Methyloglobulus sp.]
MKQTMLLALLVSNQTFAGGMGHHEPKGGNTNIHSNNHIQNTYSPSNAQAYGVGIGKGGAGGQGGNAYSGGGNATTSVSGVGNTNYNVPRQTPMAYAPSSYSANPCIMNYSAGGSGAPFGFSLGISAESDECNARADSVRWQELNMTKVACNRMLVNSDENQEALKASGLTCNEVDRVAVAIPVDQAQNISTPALDEYVRRSELNQKLDDKFNDKMLK